MGGEFWEVWASPLPDTADGEMVDLPCGYCGGEGFLRRGANCPVCWGKGRVPVRVPYEKCDRCGGRGDVPGTALTCSKCGGKGWITAHRPANACPRCGGRGFEPPDEYTLREASLGLTIRERRKAGIPPRSLRTSRIPCRLCQGSGVVDWLDTPPATTRRSGWATVGVGDVDSGEPARSPLSLADRGMAYVMGSPGAEPREVAIIFDLSLTEADRVLQGLAEKGNLSQEGGQYYLS